MVEKKEYLLKLINSYESYRNELYNILNQLNIQNEKINEIMTLLENEIIKEIVKKSKENKDNNKKTYDTKKIIYLDNLFKNKDGN